MKEAKDSAGTEGPSGQSPLEGSGTPSSKSFVARISKYMGQESGAHETGAAMVEMAFIFSILVMLLVGVVTSAIAFGQKNSIENSAREASRYAATYPAPDNNPEVANWDQWLEKVRDVARAAAQGNLDPAVDGQYICVAHIGSGRRLVDTNGAPSFSNDTCYIDGLSDLRVQVETRRDTEINAAFFSVDFTLKAPATARYERAE